LNLSALAFLLAMTGPVLIFFPVTGVPMLIFWARGRLSLAGADEDPVALVAASFATEASPLTPPRRTVGPNLADTRGALLSPSSTPPRAEHDAAVENFITLRAAVVGAFAGFLSSVPLPKRQSAEALLGSQERTLCVDHGVPRG